MPATLLAQAGKVFEARFLQPKKNWIADGRLGSGRAVVGSLSLRRAGRVACDHDWCVLGGMQCNFLAAVFASGLGRNDACNIDCRVPQMRLVTDHTIASVYVCPKFTTHSFVRDCSAAMFISLPRAGELLRGPHVFAAQLSNPPFVGFGTRVRGTVRHEPFRSFSRFGVSCRNREP
jgi:hypothetical protein